MAEWIFSVFLQFNRESVRHSLTAEPVNEEEFNTIVYDWTPKVTWTQYQEKSTSLKNSMGMYHIRQQRSKLLQECDWIMTPDHFNILANQSDWIAYRQALRDLPTSNIEFKWIPGTHLVDFDRMTFPTKPPMSRV